MIASLTLTDRETASMKLTDEELAMRAGVLGEARQWAIEHQIKVGRYLGAEDFVPVTQAHVMADTESLGAAGVEWLVWPLVRGRRRCVARCLCGRLPDADRKSVV